jgi:hypothetical protein
MASGSSAGIFRGAEYIAHVTGVRMRLNGTGELKMSLHNLDDTRTFTMLPLQMQTSPGLEPTRIANFRSQRTKFRILTTELNEYFLIQRVIVFIKPSASSYPG